MIDLENDYFKIFKKKVRRTKSEKKSFTFLLIWRSNFGQISIFMVFSESLDPKDFKFLLRINKC